MENDQGGDADGAGPDGTGPGAHRPMADGSVADRADVPAYSTGWVARRLGVSPATLRTWYRRYRIGPTGRTEGGHRRYLPADLERLERMRRLVLAGMPTAEAARMSADPDTAPPARPVRRRGTSGTASLGVGTRARRLSEAAMSLDQPAMEPLLMESLRRDGVVSTWMELVVPVLLTMGERYARDGDGVEAEHLFTECVRAALAGIVTMRHDWDGYPPVLLACLDQELHSLPLNALAAALAEQGCPSRVLGASVPIEALITATRQLGPRAVFLWAHAPSTARATDLHALPPRRPPTPVVVGGPGWQDDALPASATRVHSLADAVAAVSLGLTPTTQ